jgi:hypothetical protein
MTSLAALDRFERGRFATTGTALSISTPRSPNDSRQSFKAVHCVLGKELTQATAIRERNHSCCA